VRDLSGVRDRAQARRLGIALALTSCSATPQVVPPDEQSEYVDLYLSGGVRACGGLLDSYDRFIERSFEMWAEREPGDFHVRVEVESGVGCGGAIGCAALGRARISNADSQYHELAHTVTFDVDGYSALPLAEGVAVSFGEAITTVVSPETLQTVDMGAFFSTDADVTLRNGIGGPYMRFLLDMYGAESVRAYYRKMHEITGPDLADFSREFTPIFGESLDQSWAEFVSEPRCDYGLWFCDATEPLPLPLAVDAVDCDDDGSLGFSDDPLVQGGNFRAWRLVQLADEGAVDLIVRYANVDVRLLWCGECADQGEADAWIGMSRTPKERTLSLRSGIKVFRIYHIDPAAPMLFEVRKAEG
jgi:hypothetical protein